MAKLNKYLLLTIFLLYQINSQTTQCQNPNYIIPYDPIDQTFDTTIDFIRGQNQLVTLIQNPNANTFKDYILSLAPFAGPLFGMAALTFVLFVATIVQVICFNSCGKDCCGNQINSSTYNVCCFKTMVASYVLISFIIVCIAIAGLIVNSDMQKSFGFVSCNSQNIIYETYNGNTNKSISWSGINNFDDSVNVFSINIQNNVPFLTQYFSNSNPSFEKITNTSANSAYNLSQQFNCQNSNINIACPFANNSICAPSYQAQFNSQFCNSSFSGSASNLIAMQMSQNSTAWFNGTQSIGTTFNNSNTNAQDVKSMVDQITSFSNSVGSYQTSLLSGLQQAGSIQDKVSIAFYVFYSIILAFPIFATVSVCMVYFCKVFSCRYAMYFYWYFFFLIALLLFINSGLFFGTTVFVQDGCLAYPYYFKNQTHFNQLSFQDAQVGSIFETCYFSNNKNSISIFAGFTNTSILSVFNQLYNQYQAAKPSPQFTTVVSQIQAQLVNYVANPNLVFIENVDSSIQPSQALYQTNLFANYTLPGSTQSCKLTRDYFTFNVVNCGLNLINQPVGTNTCMFMRDPNYPNQLSGRINSFNSNNCTTDSSIYQNNANSLLAYGNSIAVIVFSLAPIEQSNTPLQNYQKNYFNYYSDVLNFYNSDIQQIFNGFFNPLQELYLGSSCGFVTTSMNGIVDLACNQVQPYVSLFTSLNIVQSVFMFILFLLSYFLTTRFAFYQFLEGNFTNFGVDTVNIKQLQNMTAIDSTNRNVQLLNNSQG